MLMLMKRIEDLHSEQAYLKELRADDSDEDTGDELPELPEEVKAKQDGDDEEETKEDGGRLTPPESDVKKNRLALKEEEDLQELEERVVTDP